MWIFRLMNRWYFEKTNGSKPHSWWIFVEQAAFREKKANQQRKFPVFRQRFGHWRDMGFTDTKDAGFTLGYDD